MLDAKKLLQYEYFPDELPECFTSKGLADNYNVLKGQANSINAASSPFLFSIYKGKNARRRMAIPNPLNYMRMVNCLVENQSELKALFDKSVISLTKPSDNQDNTEKRAYNRISNSLVETRLANEKLFSNHSICIRLDVSNFFDSIYTHSVAWAIHTKETAKASRNDSSLLGNKLDRALQNLNDKQTHGILVGNAVSRLIAEIILCDIDEKITNEYPYINVCRFVDDYSFYISDKESPNTIISFVRNQLLKYDLVLNESKTKIIHAPFILERSGIDEIKAISTNDAYTYYNRMMLLFDKYKDLSLLKYGLSIIELIVKECDFENMFPLLIHNWVTFPSLAYKILPTLYKFRESMTSKQKKELKESLTSVIVSSIELRQEVEAVWALWSMTLFGFKLNQSLIRKICDSNNDLAIIVALTCIKENGYRYYNDVVRKLVDRIKIESNDLSDTSDMIFCSHWLLIYELVRKGIVEKSVFECVQNNSFFKKLLKIGVDFYDPSISIETINSSDSSHGSKRRSGDIANEIISLLQLLANQNSIDDSAKLEIADSIERIIIENSEKWVYK